MSEIFHGVVDVIEIDFLLELCQMSGVDSLLELTLEEMFPLGLKRLIHWGLLPKLAF